MTHRKKYPRSRYHDPKIYFLSHPITGEIRYVGCTMQYLQERYQKHITVLTKTKCSDWIRELHSKNLQPEIKNWEPMEALDGGKDGLKYYRAIIPEALHHLKRNGFLVLEIGFDQSDAVKVMSEESGYSDIYFIKDYTGIKRVFIGKKVE